MKNRIGKKMLSDSSKEIFFFGLRWCPLKLWSSLLNYRYDKPGNVIKHSGMFLDRCRTKHVELTNPSTNYWLYLNRVATLKSTKQKVVQRRERTPAERHLALRVCLKISLQHFNKFLATPESEMLDKSQCTKYTEVGQY